MVRRGCLIGLLLLGSLVVSAGTSGSAPVVDESPPTITIGRPLAGSTGFRHHLGSQVDADFACEDEVDGSGVASCTGTVPDGDPVDTSTVGPHQFTVVAVDNAGNEASTTITYRIVRPRCDGRIATVVLDAGEQPTPGSDVILARIDGNDFSAGSGDDLVCASGAPARDRVYGGPGNDRLLLFTGHDVGVGGPGNDVIQGAEGSDDLVGGDGADQLVGGPLSDTCRGGPGRDFSSSCETRFSIP